MERSAAVCFGLRVVAAPSKTARPRYRVLSQRASDQDEAFHVVFAQRMLCSKPLEKL